MYFKHENKPQLLYSTMQNIKKMNQVGFNTKCSLVCERGVQFFFLKPLGKLCLVSPPWNRRVKNIQIAQSGESRPLAGFYQKFDPLLNLKSLKHCYSPAPGWVAWIQMTGALHVHIGENASVIQKRAVTIQKRAYSEMGFLGDL